MRTFASRFLTIAAFFAVWFSHPAALLACSVCFDASAETRGAYLGTTIFLSLLPLAFIAGVAFWLYRRVRLRDAESDLDHDQKVGST